MSRKLFAVLAAALTTLPASTYADEGVDAERVRQTIERGVNYLKHSQNPNGTWTDSEIYLGRAPGGATAICTLALLNAGVDPQDDTIKKALAAMRGLKPTKTYTAALQIMAFAAAEPKRDLLLIRRNAKWLEDIQVRAGANAGSWSYEEPKGIFTGDNSNAQFALLALYEAERVGVEVRDSTWRRALTYWKNAQNSDGSWGYQPERPGTGSMTSAGISSMIITAGQLSAGDADVVNGRVQCCGQQQHNESIDNGFNWLGAHFSIDSNPGFGRQNVWLLYYLYGIERVGRMTAQRFIGKGDKKHDWYREGAERLVNSQDRFTGYWKGTGDAEADPNVATSLALLFLAKGRRPVLVAKLKHGPPDDWNHHRSDLFNLVSYVEKAWHRDLTFQVIDPEAATVEDLLESPVLFFNGAESPQFTLEEQRRLRDYVDRGGFIFAAGCCSGNRFDAGFRELMQKIFPEPEMKLRQLPPDHPMWHAEEPVDPKYLADHQLWGIDVGCRTSVVYCPQDLSCYWELARVGRERHLPADVQADVKAAESIGINVLAYATNREVKFKLEGITPAAADERPDGLDRGRLQVANLLHGGGCNAARGALPTLLRTASEKLKLRVALEPREVRPIDPQLLDFPLVFMHGRQSFRFTPAEREKLRIYLERGGVLFADAICSSKEFTSAFRREMKTIFPEQPLERIAVNHPLFSTEFGGENLSQVERRRPESNVGNGPLKAQIRPSEPYLEGLALGDRYAVIFSPYDVSCALESHESLECEGYVRKDAARIGLNVILYALHQ